MHRSALTLRASGLAACALLALGVSQALASSHGGSSSDAVQSSITVGINNPDVYTQMTVAIAKDKGYFAAVGIKDVKVITTDNFVAGTVGGSLDITHGDTDQLLDAAAKSSTITLIGNFRHTEPHVLGVKKGIDKASDLVGQKVTAGERGGRNEYVMKVELKDLGVDPSKVDFVPLGGGSDARLEALIAGKVSGASIFPRHIAALKKAGGKVLYDKLAKVPQESVAANTGFLKKNPATVTAYWKAVLRAREYMHNPAHKKSIIREMKKDKFDWPAVYDTTWNVQMGEMNATGGFSAAQMDKLVTNEGKLEIMPAGLKWRKYFDFKPLWAAQKALGIRLSPSPSAVKPA